MTGVRTCARPISAAWNGITGMRPTAGLVSRGGVWDGWPTLNGSLGPLTRSVSDLATLLDVIVGYDPEDPITSLGVGQVPDSFPSFLDRDGLRGARRERKGEEGREGGEWARVWRTMCRGVEVWAWRDRF